MAPAARGTTTGTTQVLREHKVAGFLVWDAQEVGDLV